MPIRVVSTMLCGGVPPSEIVRLPEVRSSPSYARSTPRAWVRRPGPLHRSPDPGPFVVASDPPLRRGVAPGSRLRSRRPRARRRRSVVCGCRRRGRRRLSRAGRRCCGCASSALCKRGMPGPREGTLRSRRSRPPHFPRGCRGRGRSRGGQPRPPWNPCCRKRTSEHLRRCLLSRKVRNAAGEFVEIQSRLGADRRFQEGTDLADLDLQLAQQLGRPALGADHVPEDRPLRPARDQRLRQAFDVDERATAAPAVLFDRDETHDLVGPHVLAESEGDDTVGYNLHFDQTLILQTLITSPPAPCDYYWITQSEPCVSPEAGNAWASAAAVSRARCR